MNKKLLQVQDLEVGFQDKGGYAKVINQLNFDVYQGEILGIVGESGSGKSLTSLAIMDLLSSRARIRGGSMIFDGRDLVTLSPEEKRAYKGNEISMIFQEPMTSLNPLMKIGSQVEEMLILHKNAIVEGSSMRDQVIQMLSEVGLKEPENLYGKYPHELSGGMRQRVMIAMAMICKPKLLIADEPTTALDVTVQAQILALIQMLNKKHKTTVIFISHDLSVIQKLCHRVLIMYQGEIVESGCVKEIFCNPRNDYTKKLLSAVPRGVRWKLENNTLAVNPLDSTGKEPIMQAASISKSIEQRRMDTVDHTIDDVINHTIDHKIGVDHTDSMIKEKRVLTVKNLNVYYSSKGRKLFGKPVKKQVVKDVSFYINEGEIFGLVGESGSGKSTISKAIVGLFSDKEGTIQLSVSKPQMVFQDPYSSLNPARTIGWILEEPLKIHGGMSKEQRRLRVGEMLENVGLTKEHYERSISSLSGGQRQRVAIANALMNYCKFIVLDEPVSALDVTIQRQILDLLQKLRKQYQLTYLFISHDLNVVYELCDRIAVMKDGIIVEQGTRDEIYLTPKHEYTKQLIEVE